MGALSIKLREKYGRLTVLYRTRNDASGRPVFICKCACGTRVSVRSNSLRTGNTKSCGCLKAESSRLNVIRHWQRPKGEAALTALYASYRNGARKRKLPFTISLKLFRALIGRRCSFCGAAPKSKTCFKTNGNIVYNGIDRIKPSQGYVASNVKTCCILCNRMKGQRSEKEFLDWAKRIAKLWPNGL